MEVWVAKVICLVILLSLTCLFGMVPRFLRTTGNEKYLSIANCLAGGVLMGTTLLHLLPEVIDDVTSGLKMTGVDTDYPIATLTVGLGFLLIVFIEMLAHTIQDYMARKAELDTGSIADEELQAPDAFLDDEINLFDSMERVRRFTRASSKSSGPSSLDSAGPRTRTRSWRVSTSTKNMDPEKQTLLNNTVQNARRANTSVCVNPEPGYGTPDGDAQPTNTASQGHSHDGHAHHAHGGGHGSGHAHDHGPPTEIKGFGSILLLFALSVHSILEGMAVGSEQDWVMVFTLSGALSVHKILLAFALGVKIVEESQTLWTHIRSVAFFAISSPIGVAIGVAVQLSNTDESTKKLAEGLIQAVASGTFLYIAFVEIITPELNKPDLPPLLKVLFLAIGFAIMCCAQLVPEGDEDIKPNNGTLPTIIHGT